MLPLIHGHTPSAPGSAWEGHLSTQPLLMVGLRSCWARAWGCSLAWLCHTKQEPLSNWLKVFV